MKDDRGLSLRAKAFAQNRGKRWKDAVATSNHLLELNPNDQVSLLYLGSIYAQIGQPAQATAYWQKAKDINPSSRYGHVAQQLLAEQANPDAGVGAPALPQQ